MALKTMPVAKLQDLKNKVEAAITAKVTERRRELESELSELARRGPKGPVAPRYRNRENRAETWAGRGLKPRWLAAAIKSGKKLDDFLIPERRRDRPRSLRKTRKMRKPGK